MKKQITQKQAKEKYGIIVSKMQKLDRVKYYLLDNGNVIDSMGDIRYYKPTEYDKVMDYLNFIDEQAEQGNPDYDMAKEREKAYNKVANFIDKHAKR